MSQVQEEAEKLRKAKEKREEAIREKEQRKREEGEEQAKNDEILARREAAFVRAFPTSEEQSRYIQVILKEHPGVSAFGKFIARNLAISRWAETHFGQVA